MTTSIITFRSFSLAVKEEQDYDLATTSSTKYWDKVVQSMPVQSIGTQRIKHKRAVFVGECIKQSDRSHVLLWFNECFQMRAFGKSQPTLLPRYKANTEKMCFQ